MVLDTVITKLLDDSQWRDVISGESGDKTLLFAKKKKVSKGR